VSSATRTTLEAKLTTILNTTVNALSIWTSQRKRDARLIAERPEIRELLRGLKGQTAAASPEIAAQRRQGTELLSAACEALGYDDFALLTLSGDLVIGGELFAEMLNSDAVKHCLRTLVPEAVSLVHPTQHGLAEGTPSNPSIILLLTTISSTDGTSNNVLALRFGAPDDFTKILAVAQAGRTGETYAFDKQGKMLSASRFADTAQTGKRTTLTQLEETILRSQRGRSDVPEKPTAPEPYWLHRLSGQVCCGRGEMATLVQLWDCDEARL
jgi:hypothetical protein